MKKDSTPQEIVQNNPKCLVCGKMFRENDFSFGSDIGIVDVKILLSARKSYGEKGPEIDFQIETATGIVTTSGNVKQILDWNDYNPLLRCDSCHRWMKVFSLRFHRAGGKILCRMSEISEHIDIDYNGQLYRVTKNFTRSSVSMMPVMKDLSRGMVREMKLSHKFLTVTNYDNLSRRIQSLLVLGE